MSEIIKKCCENCWYSSTCVDPSYMVCTNIGTEHYREIVDANKYCNKWSDVKKSDDEPVNITRARYLELLKAEEKYKVLKIELKSIVTEALREE